MLFDFFLAAVFLVSTAMLWYRISLKIPELVAVSDVVIVERLHEDSARVRIFLLHFKTFYREGRHRIWLWKWCEKICFRAHILLLRMDNAVVAVLQKIRTVGGARSESQPVGLSVNEEYWFKLRREQDADGVSGARVLPRPVRAVWQRTGRHEIGGPRSAGAGRIQEVRTRRKEKTPE